MSQQPALSDDYVNQIESLKISIEAKLSYCKKKMTKNKCGAIIVRILIVLFSVSSTALIGWKLHNEINNETVNRIVLSNWALLVSVIATALTTLDGFFDYKIMWTGYNAAIAELELAKSELDYLKAGGSAQINSSKLLEIFKTYKDICQTLIKHYKTTRMEKD